VSTERVVLVTGGTRGIGRAIAERFVAAGYKTAVTARCGEGPVGALTVRADVTDAASLDAAFTEVEQQLGPVEVVVANAGITKDTLLLRMTEDDFDSVVATNLGGTFRVVKRASKGMLRAKWGRVILISSVVGLYGSAGQINYSSSKAALVGFARSLTRELGGRGITANVVAPGFIETDMTAELPDETQAEYKRSIPAGRFATADEVAGVVTWLASDDAAYISGAVIPVDGGLGMGHGPAGGSPRTHRTIAEPIAAASRSGCVNCGQCAVSSFLTSASVRAANSSPCGPQPATRRRKVGSSIPPIRSVVGTPKRRSSSSPIGAVGTRAGTLRVRGRVRWRVSSSTSHVSTASKKSHPGNGTTPSTMGNSEMSAPG